MGDNVIATVIIPCFNEELSIGSVITKIKALPLKTKIIVVDNGSTDKTASIANNLGVIVLREPKRGKGFAVRRALNNLPKETNVVLMVDGDDTYEITEFLNAYTYIISEGYDLVIGKRVSLPNIYRQDNFRFGHEFGNKLLSYLFKFLFKVNVSDTLSGWRAMSIGFADSFAGGDSEFEIEAELNAHIFTINASVKEIPVGYSGREMGSTSKLRTFRDGWAILRRNFRLYKSERPLIAYSALAIPWTIMSLVSMYVVIGGFLETGKVPRFPTLIAGVGSFIVAGNLWMTGMILERVRLQRVAIARLAYLNAQKWARN